MGLRLLATFYAGLLIGVSFLATPVKFLAESPTLAQLLEVGRWTFRVFGIVEGVVAIALLVVAVRARRWIWLAAGIVAINAVQHLVIQPILDERVTRAMSGETITSSPLHHVYVGFEVVKLIALAMIVLRPQDRPER